MSNSKTFDKILFVVFVARKWKGKISRHGCHGYDYHCSHARHGHHGHQDRLENQEKQDRQDRQIWHLNLTFQVTCVGQLSQFLWCLYMVWYGLLAQPGKRKSSSEIDRLLAQSRLKWIWTRKKQSKLCNTTQDVRVDSEQGAPILPLCNVDDQSCLQKQGASIWLTWCDSCEWGWLTVSATH